MKKYYCVTSAIDNRGRITAAITASETAATKPENTFTSTSRRDIYNDWFESLEEAEAFVLDSKNA